MENVDSRCGCGFREDRITDRGFHCFPSSPQSVTYHAQLHGTYNANASDLIFTLQDWVSEGVTIIPVQFLPLTVSSVCAVSSSVPTENCPGEATPTPASTSATTVIVAVSVAVSIAVIFIIVIAVLIAFYIRHRIRHRIRQRHSTVSLNSVSIILEYTASISHHYRLPLPPIEQNPNNAAIEQAEYEDVVIFTRSKIKSCCLQNYY